MSSPSSWICLSKQYERWHLTHTQHYSVTETDSFINGWICSHFTPSPPLCSYRDLSLCQAPKFPLALYVTGELQHRRIGYHHLLLGERIRLKQRGERVSVAWLCWFHPRGQNIGHNTNTFAATFGKVLLGSYTCASAHFSFLNIWK